MESVSDFYESLAGLSFTLLGIWFGVLQFAHGDWRTDPGRHRSSLHIALLFFLPGLASLASMLGGGAVDGIWRATFVVAGSIGFAEAASFLRAPNGRTALPERLLSVLTPVLYALMVAVAFVPRDAFTMSPLQLAGMVTGSLFLVGLCFVWLAFAERKAAGPMKDAAHG